ncbi:MAG TPA: LLM class flavin-dependent oxidoreductase [Acidimicrobiales bacterium]|nr:LLM class flavin-dependent oxidoreductase [Acidimicrobiales bacterium]
MTELARTAQERGEVRVGLVAGGTSRLQVAALEALPIDSLWVGGHIASRNPSPEAIVGLARLAALTERVRVGTSILLLPLYPPALVAKQIADLDRATGGRVVLGVGVGGEYPQEFRAMQVPLAERGRRADEAIPLIRRLWTAEPVTHEGRAYSMAEVRIHPPPLQPGGPPIVVAGRREPAMRRAGRLGDGWFPYLYSPRRYAASVATVRQAAAEAGRDLSSFEWCVWVFCNVGPDGRAAREQAARSMGGTYDQDFSQMVDRVAAAGTAEEVAARVCAFYDAGARHFVFSPATAGADPRPVIDRLMAEVVPSLREHAARGQEDAGNGPADP